MFRERLQQYKQSIKDLIYKPLSLLRNNSFHSTREELHRSIGQIVSVKKRLSIYTNFRNVNHKKRKKE